MEINRVEFQAVMSLNQFLAEYGTKQQCEAGRGPENKVPFIPAVQADKQNHQKTIHLLRG